MTLPLAIGLFLSLLLTSGGCANAQTAPALVRKPAAAHDQRLTIASYNVENLFDTLHDEGKDDFEFLPNASADKQAYCGKQAARDQKRCLAIDWTESHLELKLGQIRKVFEKFPRRPAIMGLIEIENANVTGRLARELGYSKFLVTESEDARGVDVGILYDESAGLKFVRQQSHRLNLIPFGGKPTRDLLEVEFAVGPKNIPLVVIVSHWPSQMNPTATRLHAAVETVAIAKAAIARGAHVVVLGDFNTELLNDVPSPFAVFGNPETDGVLVDIDRLHRMGSKPDTYSIENLSPGTYFYGVPGRANTAPSMNWNMLDHFFVSRSLLGPAAPRADVPSYRILVDPEWTGEFVYEQGPLKGSRIVGIPKRSNHAADRAEDAGFSDHFPIVFDLLLN